MQLPSRKRGRTRLLPGVIGKLALSLVPRRYPLKSMELPKVIMSFIIYNESLLAAPEFMLTRRLMGGPQMVSVEGH